MLPLGLFLYPLVLGASCGLTIDGYVIDIQADSVPSSLSTERLSDDSNVLELDKRRFDKSVLDSASSTKVLNPADNFLVVLPQSVLSIAKNLDLPSRKCNGTAQNSTETDAEVCKVELPEVIDNPVESLAVGNFNRSAESVDSTIRKCLEKAYSKLLDYQLRRVNLRMANEEQR